MATTTAATRFFGRKAEACKKCGGVEHYVNRVGGISCERCFPPKTDSDRACRLVVGGGVWCDPANGFDGPQVERQGGSIRAAETHGQAATSSPSTEPAPQPPTPAPQPAAVELADPTFPATHVLLVSSRLEWFALPIVAGGAGDGPGYLSLAAWPPVGQWRQLSRDYFAWMVLQVAVMASKLAAGHADSLKAHCDLCDIAFHGVLYGVLGEWALDESAWPRSFPDGFRVPEVWRLFEVGEVPGDHFDHQDVARGYRDWPAWDRLLDFDREWTNDKRREVERAMEKRGAA